MNILRDDHGVAHVVALSGGKDSTAMALALCEREPSTPFTYICTPTGDELPEMWEHWKRCEDMLGEPVHKIGAGTLNGLVEKQHTIPNFRMRFCTGLLKIEPFHRFLLLAMPAISYIGLRADEAERSGATHGGELRYGQADGIRQRFPLREWGWDIEDVYKFLNERNVTIPDRTDCARCFFQRLGEWYLLWQNHPDIYADAERQEAEIGATWRSPGRDTWPADLAELRQKFERGEKPEISLRMMDKRKGMCRVCTL